MLHSRLLFPVLQVLLHRMRMLLDVGNLILELYNLQPAAVRNTLQSLGRPVSARLEVEGTLVLQPPSVSSHATNLLAVVVRWGVR